VIGNDNQEPGKSHRHTLLGNAVAGLRRPDVARLCGWVALLLWCAPLTERDGWFVQLVGWVGLLFHAPAWYANLPFVIHLIELFNGRYPEIRSASIAAALAATLLMPHTAMLGHNSIAIWDAWSLSPLLWSWLGAFAFVWLLALVKAIWLTDK
jgi:hypothetical protein